MMQKAFLNDSRAVRSLSVCLALFFIIPLNKFNKEEIKTLAAASNGLVANISEALKLANDLEEIGKISEDQKGSMTFQLNKAFEGARTLNEKVTRIISERNLTSTDRDSI